VGEVLRTDIEYEEVDNVLDATAKIPVMIELVPARFGFEDTEVAVRDAETQINQIITSGLHGALATGNLMTGQKLVELQYFEHEPHPEETFAGVTVIPSVSGQVGRLIDSAASAIDKINKLPMSDVTTSAGKALEQAATTLAQLDTVLEDVDIREVMERLNDTFLRFQELAEDFSAGSETHENLQKSLRSLEQSLNELEPLLRNLRRKPNSLIFSGPDTEDPEPKGARE
jgi:paraquat-inducible protein B